MWIWVLVVVVALIAVGVVVSRRQRPPVSDERLEELDLRLSHEARVAVGTAIAKGRTIEAIKLYREHTGADLATSRAAVAKWAKGIHG